MLPSEVIVMRDQVAQVIKRAMNIRGGDDRIVVAATELIREGWVVAPPKNEGGNNGD